MGKPIHNHFIEHAQMGYPATDADGNLLASVVPRSDTLANLLAITDAGIGEIAYATDQPATVIYEDEGAGVSRGIPVFHIGSDVLGTINFNTSGYTSGGWQTLDILSFVGQTQDLEDTTNDIINKPTYLPIYSADEFNGGAVVVEAHLSIFGISADANTIFQVTMEKYNGSTWSTLTDSNVDLVANSSGIVRASGALAGTVSGLDIGSWESIRFRMNYTSASAPTFLSIKGTLRMTHTRN